MTGGRSTISHVYGQEKPRVSRPRNRRPPGRFLDEEAGERGVQVPRGRGGSATGLARGRGRGRSRTRHVQELVVATEETTRTRRRVSSPRSASEVIIAIMLISCYYS